MMAPVRAARRLARGATIFTRFVIRAVSLFDATIPHFRSKTTLVVVAEFVAALAGGVSWTVLVPFLQQLTGGRTDALPEGLLGDVYRFVGERFTLITVALVVFAAVTLKNALTFLSVAAHTRMAADLSHALRSRVFAAYVASDLRYFEQAQDGRFINVFNQEIPRTEKILKVWRRAISGALNALVYLVLLCLISPLATGLFLAGAGVLQLTLMRFYYRLRENGYALTRLMEGVNARVSEAIRCFVLVKSVGTEAREQTHFERASRR